MFKAQFDAAHQALHALTSAVFTATADIVLTEEDTKLADANKSLMDALADARKLDA